MARGRTGAHDRICKPRLPVWERMPNLVIYLEIVSASEITATAWCPVCKESMPIKLNVSADISGNSLRDVFRTLRRRAEIEHRCKKGKL